MVQRSRAFVFTQQSWNDIDRDLLGARYLLYGRETAPTTGRKHLQGYVYFNDAKTLPSVIRKLPNCHVESARGSFTQNQVYCKKDGDFVESGDPPSDPVHRGLAEIDRWNLTWDLAKQGRIEEIPADIRIRSYTTLRRIERDYMRAVTNLESCCGIWIFGLSGSGKTRNVLATYPTCFPKPRNLWWDGYQGEEIVLLDDVDKYDVKLGGQLKHWADFCPFIAQIKGSSQKIRPKKIIITSQYLITEIWDDEETRVALLRRFTVMEKKEGILLEL